MWTICLKGGRGGRGGNHLKNFPRSFGRKRRIGIREKGQVETISGSTKFVTAKTGRKNKRRVHLGVVLKGLGKQEGTMSRG